MRLWIDIANAPHATLFGPIATELERRGCEVVVTSWDRGQTAALVAQRWPDAISVDAGSFARSRLDKATRIGRRAWALREALRDRGCQVALGHNSYAQAVAARGLMPLITMMDYEHQPANHLAFRLAARVVIPEALDVGDVRRYGATRRKTIRYDGVKESLTLAGFAPDPTFRASVGLRSDVPVVTLRPAAEGALYHRQHNDLFDDVVVQVQRTGAQVLLTPRTPGQADRYERRGIQVLRQAVSGPDLLYQSDVFVGAGGTMTREAAVLGTRTFSVFEGRPAAVDGWLEAQGMLSTLASAEAVVRAVSLRDRSWEPDDGPVRRFVDQLLPVMTSMA